MAKVIALTKAQLADLEPLFAELREHKQGGAIVAQIFRDGMRVSVQSPGKVIAICHALKGEQHEPVLVKSAYE